MGDVSYVATILEVVARHLVACAADLRELAPPKFDEPVTTEPDESAAVKVEGTAGLAAILPGRGRPMTDEVLVEVARVYRHAMAAGTPPTKAVEIAFGTTRSSAGRLVGQARRAGLLGPAVGRRGGERLVAV